MRRYEPGTQRARSDGRHGRQSGRRRSSHGGSECERGSAEERSSCIDDTSGSGEAGPLSRKPAGRKNLVWLAGSFPLDILPNLNPNLANTNGMSANFAGADTRGYMTAIRDLAFLLQSSNIVVYPIDVRGPIDNGAYNAGRTGSGGAASEVRASTQGLGSFTLTNGQMHGAMETMASSPAAAPISIPTT